MTERSGKNGPTAERGGRSCERCESPAEFHLHSAYESPLTATHPLVHRYPAAMYGACAEHVGDLLNADRDGSPLWVVSRERLSWVGGSHG